MGHSYRMSSLQDERNYTDNFQPCILNIISAAFMAGSTNIGEFIFFRFVAGASAFMLLGAVPVCTAAVGTDNINTAADITIDSC